MPVNNSCSHLFNVSTQVLPHDSADVGPAGNGGGVKHALHGCNILLRDDIVQQPKVLYNKHISHKR